MFLKVIEIVSIFSKLLKAVGFFAACLCLAERRLKNHKEKEYFSTKIRFLAAG